MLRPIAGYPDNWLCLAFGEAATDRAGDLDLALRGEADLGVDLGEALLCTNWARTPLVTPMISSAARSSCCVSPIGDEAADW